MSPAPIRSHQSRGFGNAEVYFEIFEEQKAVCKRIATALIHLRRMLSQIRDLYVKSLKRKRKFTS